MALTGWGAISLHLAVRPHFEKRITSGNSVHECHYSVLNTVPYCLHQQVLCLCVVVTIETAGEGLKHIYNHPTDLLWSCWHWLQRASLSHTPSIIVRTDRAPGGLLMFLPSDGRVPRCSDEVCVCSPALETKHWWAVCLCVNDKCTPTVTMCWWFSNKGKKLDNMRWMQTSVQFWGGE